jgi:hypothetical protein
MSVSGPKRTFEMLADAALQFRKADVRRRLDEIHLMNVSSADFADIWATNCNWSFRPNPAVRMRSGILHRSAEKQSFVAITSRSYGSTSAMRIKLPLA